jgi:hypothetical protein
MIKVVNVIDRPYTNNTSAHLSVAARTRTCYTYDMSRREGRRLVKKEREG